jgi:RHS repeat-associated protein
MRLLSETREPLFEQQARHHSLYIYEDEGSYEPLARVDSTSGDEKEQARVLHFHNDLSGKPEALSSAEQGQVIWRASYKVWGNTLSEEWSGEYAQVDARTVAQNIRFQGQYLDPETGLHYNTFRYYDPDIGRFTTPDPIGLNGGLNLYQYAPNPISWIDPWGWCKQSARLRTVGRTPGKGSKTGKSVIARMRAEGRFRGTNENGQFKDSKGNWHSVKDADMGHTKDAVSYWNQRGGFHGAKSKEVRAWMRDPNNYELQHYSANRSAGARNGMNYKDPSDFIGPAERPDY